MTPIEWAPLIVLVVLVLQHIREVEIVWQF